MIEQDDLGSLFLTGLGGSELSTSDARLLEQLRPSGVILFKHNFKFDCLDWQSALERLLNDVRSAVGRQDLLVSIDHEGGRVHRFPEPVTRFPAAVKWGDLAKDAASSMASELFCLGFNLSFAPVLDVLSEPTNTVIGDRAFSSEPLAAAEKAVEVMKSIEQAGVMACGKHFPGHGATFADSHEELPVLDVSLETLAGRELIPFKSAVDSGLRLVMSAHVLYPQLDSDNPATFSHRIMTNLLRGELGYEHAVVSDDLEMLGAAGVPLGERGVHALEAGVDLLLVGNPSDKQPLQHASLMHQGLLKGLESGKLSDAAVVRAIENVRKTRVYASSLGSSQAKQKHAAIVGCEAHRALCEKIARS